MSATAALGLQVVSSGVVLATKAFDSRKKNQQAIVQMDQQRRQANHELVVGISPHAVSLAVECVKARSIILQSRQESMRIELERDTMTRQADIIQQDMTNRHTHAMNKLNQSGQMFQQAIEANQQAALDNKDNIAMLDSQIMMLISAMTQIGINTADIAFYLEALKELHVEKKQLIEAHRQINSQSHSAFIHSCDSGRDTPRTYTDISSSR